MGHLDGWEKNVYSQGKHLNRFTYGEVYYFTHRYLLPSVTPESEVNILELGCGAGNNLVFFAELGLNVYGIEVSPSACSVAEQRLEEFGDIKAQVVCGNFCDKPLPFDANILDLVVDRGAITHNVLPDIKKILAESYHALKRGGFIFSVHFFSDRDSRFGRGREVECNTYTDIGGYSFKDVPLVHFSNLREVEKLYADFELVVVEEQTIRRPYHPEDEEAAHFTIVARKP